MRWHPLWFSGLRCHEVTRIPGRSHGPRHDVLSLFSGNCILGCYFQAIRDGVVVIRIGLALHLVRFQCQFSFFKRGLCRLEHLVHLVAEVSPGAKKGSTAPYSRAELVMPPQIEAKQVAGTALYAAKAVLNGRFDDVKHLLVDNFLKK